MEINNKRKLLRPPLNLTIGAPRQNKLLSTNIGVSISNLSRIVDLTQRTQFKQQESILNDFDVLLNTKRGQRKDAQDDDEAENLGNSGEIQPQMYGSNNDNETQKFNQHYEQAIQILMCQSQSKRSTSHSLKKAHQILSSLIYSIKSKKLIDLKYQMAQNIVLNYWKVASDLFYTNDENNQQKVAIKTQKSKKQAVQEKQKQKVIGNISEIVPILEELSIKQKTRINKLTLLCLILAKQHFKQKDMGKALQFCQKGFKYCPKFKNTSLLLKLHYLKSKIYNSIHAVQPEQQQIKKCIFYIKNLSNNSQQNKYFGYQFMRVLVKRRDQLKAIIQNNPLVPDMYNFHKSVQKFNNTSGGIGINAISSHNKLSLTKFRKRSSSLSKIKSLNQQPVEKGSNQAYLKNTFKKSLQKDMPNSTYNLMNNQAKKQFLKLDINRKTKLKKKGQTLTVWEKNSQKINFQNKIAKQLQQDPNQKDMSDIPFGNLLLRRPNAKNTKKSQSQYNKQTYEQKVLDVKINQRDLLTNQGNQRSNLLTKNSINNASLNIKLQLKPQNGVNQGFYSNDFPHQSLNDDNLIKNKFTQNRSDSQLLNFISGIQQQILDNFFLKSAKFYHNKQNLDELENDFTEKDEFSQEGAYVSRQFGPKQGGTREIQVNAIRAKRQNQFDQDPIQQQSYDSQMNPFTRKIVPQQDNAQERICFNNIISTQQKKNEAITPYGILQQMSLQVIRKSQHLKYTNSPSSSFVFYLAIVLNGDYYKLQMVFPEQKQVLEAVGQKDNNRSYSHLQEDFYQWIFARINEQKRRNNQKVQYNQNKYHDFNLNYHIIPNLIQTIIQNLSIKASQAFGYRILQQKSTGIQNHSIFSHDEANLKDYEKQIIFEWRQKNFQYIQQSQQGKLSFDNNLLSLKWKSSKVSQINISRNNQQASEYMKQQQLNEIQTFFIQLEKISSNQQEQQNETSFRKDGQPNDIINNQAVFLVSKYNVASSDSNQKSIDSYVLTVSQRKNCDDQNENNDDGSEQSLNQSDYNIDDLSNKQIEVCNYRKQSKKNNEIIKSQQYSAKNKFLKIARQPISLSFFPKHKYFQLIQRNYQSQNSVQIKKYRQQPQIDESALRFSPITVKVNTNSESCFVIRVVGSLGAQNPAKKKGSVRKSQIIQLQQNLNHSNFIKQIQKCKSKMYLQSHFNDKGRNKQIQIQKGCNDSQKSKGKETSSEVKSHYSINKSGSQGQKGVISNMSIVKILKRALIQPQYKKSALLMTYFDSISVSSFYNIMGVRPNYIKLTCFRMKTVYIQKQSNMNYYYLFQLQQRQARTRMHKFIIEDKQVRHILGRTIKTSFNQGYPLRKETIRTNKQNNLIHRSTRHTRTLPQNKKIDSLNSDQRQQVNSYENKYHKKVGTSSKLKTKQTIHNHNRNDSQDFHSIREKSSRDLQLKFTQQSLTQIIKSITPYLVIKKDYIYTSICLKCQDNMFYLMNRFSIDQQQVFNSTNPDKNNMNPSQRSSNKQLNYLNQRNNQKAMDVKIRTSISKKINKNTVIQQKINDNTYFLSKQIKRKKILCQKSLVLQISQNFADKLEKQNRRKVNKLKKGNKVQFKRKQKPHDNRFQNEDGKTGFNSTNLGNKSVGLLRSKGLFSILTIIKISKSSYFTIKLYIPKLQRSYVLTLDKTFITYLQLSSFIHIFKDFHQVHSILVGLQQVWSEKQSGRQNKSNIEPSDDRVKSQQKIRKSELLELMSSMLFQQEFDDQKLLWRYLLELVKVEEKWTEDKVYIVVKIDNYSGFIKDCSLLQYFQKNGNIYMLEMTINRKSQNSHYFPKQNSISSLQGNKIKHGILTGKSKHVSLKNTFHRNSSPKTINPNMFSFHNQQFQRITSIYQSKAQEYTLYVQIFKIYEEVQLKRHKTSQKGSLKNYLNSNNDRNSGFQRQNQSSFLVCVEESASNINYRQDSAHNMSQNQVQSSQYKSNNMAQEKRTVKAALKSTKKPISLHPQHGGSSTANKSIRLRYPGQKHDPINSSKNNKQQATQYSNITKINFSFYLNQLNDLFKYIDQNYSEEFNEEYFLLAQMNQGFKILGQIIMEQFKSLGTSQREKKSIHRNNSIQNQQQEEPTRQFGQRKLSKKKSLKKKKTHKLSFQDVITNTPAQQQVYKQVSVIQKIQQQSISKGYVMFSKSTIQKQLQHCQKARVFTSQQLFSQYENQKKFKKKILRRLRQFKQKIKQMQQSQILSQKQDYLKDANQQESILKNLAQQEQKLESQVNASQGNKMTDEVSIKQKQKQTFISLHSKLSNPGLVDLHILSSDKANQISSLFYQFGSLLFLISNVRDFKINVISVKIDQQHPFSFINILQQKKQLKCIRNRLFRFYKNLLLLMAKQQANLQQIKY